MQYLDKGFPNAPHKEKMHMLEMALADDWSRIAPLVTAAAVKYGPSIANGIWNRLKSSKNKYVRKY